ncbi:DUF5316 family protein [Camelliibacillus cellulosilyticus]|uniref:DUF5316 family protein n=1 Tax=Camelliibacillus cellulosilyticus TaxID=2174486 RepID=A0ABV9GHY4_9BACL
MLKSLVYGILIFITILLGAALVGDLRAAMSFAGGLGLVCMIMCGVLSRAFVSDESTEWLTDIGPMPERKKHVKWKMRTLLFALPNVVGAAVVLIYMHPHV